MFIPLGKRKKNILLYVVAHTYDAITKEADCEFKTNFSNIERLCLNVLSGKRCEMAQWVHWLVHVNSKEVSEKRESLSNT